MPLTYYGQIHPGAYDENFRSGSGKKFQVRIPNQHLNRVRYDLIFRYRYRNYRLPKGNEVFSSKKRQNILSQRDHYLLYTGVGCTDTIGLLITILTGEQGDKYTHTNESTLYWGRMPCSTSTPMGRLSFNLTASAETWQELLTVITDTVYLIEVLCTGLDILVDV